MASGKRFFAKLPVLLVLAVTTTAIAGSRFGQIVLSFPEKREFTQTFDEKEHSITLEIKKTSPAELTAFDRYDERLMKRVVIKDFGPQGVQVRMFLRDRNVRASISQFNEPFRIAVDFFDRDYQEARDPITGFPITVAPADNSAAPAQASGVRQLLANPASGGRDGVASAVANSPPPPTTTDGSNANSKRHLLQPTPELFQNPEEFLGALGNAADGLGKGWKELPIYVYRLQTAPFEGRDTSAGWMKKGADEAVASAKAMAAYAGRLYDLGQEGKALLAYQQVLYREPKVFEDDPLHLWKFAEIQLGQGNLTLASGYYQTLIDKHQGHALTRFATIRLLDLAAIKYTREGATGKLSSLIPKVREIVGYGNGELKAQAAIREAYWRTPNQSDDNAAAAVQLPALTNETRKVLNDAYPTVESPKTAFLTASLLLNDLLGPAVPWNSRTGQFAGHYFDRFTGPATEPQRSFLASKLMNKFDLAAQEGASKGKYLDVVQNYESLPKSLASEVRNPKTAWAIAESYRLIGQKEKALPFYELAAAGSGEGIDRFRAFFWLAITAADASLVSKVKSQSVIQTNSLRAIATRADHAMLAAWKTLHEQKKREVYVGLKDTLERAATHSSILQAPPQIALAMWGQGLGTTVSTTTGGEPNDWRQSFSPSGAAVVFLTDLAKKFTKLGMGKERRETIAILKNIKPSDFKGDQNAMKLWSAEILGLAEEYRKASQFMEAGRLYALAGAESADWEGRAASLYKGGLLLYRAGRREEAVEALKKASEDGNNLFYSNLAKERLNQIENK